METKIITGCQKSLEEKDKWKEHGYLGVQE